MIIILITISCNPALRRCTKKALVAVHGLGLGANKVHSTNLQHSKAFSCQINGKIFKNNMIFNTNLIKNLSKNTNITMLPCSQLTRLMYCCITLGKLSKCCITFCIDNRPKSLDLEGNWKWMRMRCLFLLPIYFCKKKMKNVLLG